MKTLLSLEIKKEVGIVVEISGEFGFDDDLELNKRDEITNYNILGKRLFRLDSNVCIEDCEKSFGNVNDVLDMIRCIFLSLKFRQLFFEILIE